MAKKLKFYDEAPDGRGRRHHEMDDYMIQVMENPGKWAVIEERENERYRSTTWLKARYGAGFAFKTTVNQETGLVEVWASYHPDAS